MKQKIKTISCPYCGRDYVVGEIFIPNYVIGQPTTVIRDSNDKIIGIDGIEADNEETYTCDKCHNTFKVKMITSCTVQKLESENKYESELKPQKLILSESSE